MTREQFEKCKLEYMATGIEPIELMEYKVDNAIILAAGISKDTMYSPPKGLLKINGVPIIERQIRQLQDAGITDITIVVGYKKEMYFYLEEKYNVTLIGNPRLDKNNVYSLYLAKHKLKNTYICSCDYFYEDNPFSKHEFRSYQATTFLQETSEKFCVKTNSKGRIIDIIAGLSVGECINGLAFFDKEFSRSIKVLLDAEIDKYRVDSLFWEEFVGKHLDELDLFVKNFEKGKIREFDDLSSLKTLSVLFVDSINSQIVKNICEQLNCKSSKEISNVDILEAGHSNITFKVIVNDSIYVYRYPGISGKNIVSRKRETYINKLAKELEIDKTLLFIDESGHKISKYVPNARPLNKNNQVELETLAKHIYKLHNYVAPKEIQQRYAFDPLSEADRLLNLACTTNWDYLEYLKCTKNKTNVLPIRLT